MCIQKHDNLIYCSFVYYVLFTQLPPFMGHLVCLYLHVSSFMFLLHCILLGKHKLTVYKTQDNVVIHAHIIEINRICATTINNTTDKSAKLLSNNLHNEQIVPPC